MAHLGTIYKFKLRDVNSKECRLLGSIDGKGCRLCDKAPDLLKAINHTVQIDDTNDPQPSVTFKSSISVDSYHQCAAILNRYEYGSRGELNRHAEGDTIPFYEVDNQRVDVAIVISAPSDRSVGFIGLHVPNNKRVKTGVEAELRSILKENYNLKLELEPVIPTDVIEAIERDGVGCVTFRKLYNPEGLFYHDDARWTETEKIGSVDLQFKPSRNRRFFDIGKRISRFLKTTHDILPDNEEAMNFVELATINEETYDELKVDIKLNGRDKVIRVHGEGYSMSHAISWDLGVGITASATELVTAITDLLPE